MNHDQTPGLLELPEELHAHATALQNGEVVGIFPAAANELIVTPQAIYFDAQNNGVATLQSRAIAIGFERPVGAHLGRIYCEASVLAHFSR